MATQYSQNTRPNGTTTDRSDTEFPSARSTNGSNGSYLSSRSTSGSNGSYFSARSTQGSTGNEAIYGTDLDFYQRVLGISGAMERDRSLQYYRDMCQRSLEDAVDGPNSAFANKESHAQSIYRSDGSRISMSIGRWARSNPAAHSNHQFPGNFQLKGLGKLPESAEVSLFASKLIEKDILQPPNKELDWSGRGQHVEYDFHNSSGIPLERLDYLGHSATAMVESVRCTRGRRVKLARKTIRCSRRMTMDEVLVEVEALQKLNHPHIIQLVGSYLLEDYFSLLLYPVADCHLGKYLERSLNERHPLDYFSYDVGRKMMRCLIQAVLYVHSQNIKHGDIKPQNMLIRHGSRDDNDSISQIRLYLSDFGVARKFKDESYTKDNSVTAFSRVYCAPEVYDCEPWGRSADLFSMGWVLFEIELATNGRHGKCIEISSAHGKLGIAPLLQALTLVTLIWSTNGLPS